MGFNLGLPLAGALLWVISIYVGCFTTASILHGSPVTWDPQSFYSAYKDKFVNTPKIESILKILKKDGNDSVIFATSVINRMTRLETNLGWSNIHVQRDTPAHGQLIESSAAEEALQQARAALIAAKASQYLINTHCQRFSSNKKQCAKYLTSLKMTATPLEAVCNTMRRKCRIAETESKYRSIDGSCNHVSDSAKGKSFTGYSRLVFSSYFDGIAEPRKSTNRKPLPSARLVSTKLIQNMEKEDPRLTLAFMQWSQFVSHDMAHTASSKMISSSHSVTCCDRNGGNLAPRYIHPFCYPITIPSDDPFYSKYRTNCMTYVRSLPALSSDCTFGPIDQMNQVTHFLDGSHIYGSTITKNNKLREGTGGRLLVSHNGKRNFLPMASNPEEDCQVLSSKSECYRAGDVRVNMQPHLTAMHVFWLREHNRLAVILAEMNPAWSDERLFQEARRIVIAEIQHITYSEWLPVLLGKKYGDKLKTHNEFKEDVDPTVSNSFATAAIKFTTSLIGSKLRIYKENRNTSVSLRLQDHFNKPIVIEKPGNLDGLVRGLATQPSQSMDMDVVSDVTQQLYRSGLFGFDALSLDIQRGRDHGLPGYTEFRDLCGLPTVQDFDDLKDFIPAETVEAMRKLYHSPQDVDLLVGGMAENPYGESLLGPTFTSLIAEQMYRTRVGDRYFYTHDKQPESFSPEQLKEIKRTSLARIFCDNGDDIRTMQRDVFTAITEKNNLVDCKDQIINKMDLSPWGHSKEKASRRR